MDKKDKISLESKFLATGYEIVKLDILDEKKFRSRLNLEIYNKKNLKDLLQKISPIDFILAYIEKTEFEEYILKLREQLEKTNDLEAKAHLRKTILKYDPERDAKISMLIEAMLNKCEELSIGLGMFSGSSYFYNGEFWESMSLDMTKELLTEVAERSGLNHYFAKKNDVANQLIKQYSFSAVVPAPTQDDTTVKINLKNGTFKISELEQKLYPFQSSDMLRYQLPFDYDPKAKATRWINFLDEVLPEKESQSVLAEFLGSIFYKNFKHETCLVLVGTGANGKSVVYDVVKALLGEQNISGYTLRNLCDDNGYYRVKICDKLLNYSSEIGGKGSNSDMVKKLISGEPIEARSPYGEPFELRNYCRFMFNANLLPKDVEQTDAYHRRFKYLKFEKKIAKHRQDKKFAEKLINIEMSGVFNWVLEGLNRLISQGDFTYSKVIESVSVEISNESNSVALFMDESIYLKEQKDKQELKFLYIKYSEYCKENGHHAVSKPEFSRRLEMLGYIIKRKQTNNATWVFGKIKVIEVKKDPLTVVEKLRD